MTRFIFNPQSLPIVLAVLAGVALSGCTQEVGAPEEVAQAHDSLYRTGTPWPNSSVNVCIDPVDNGGADGPALVAEARRELAATWGKYTNLQFNGSSASGAGQPNWGTCSYGFTENGNYSTIALHFCTGSSPSGFCTSDAGVWDKGFPTAGGYRGGTARNGGYTGWVAPTMFTEQYDVLYAPGVEHMGLIGDYTDATLRRFRYEVIHEFGHALGFDHEQNRPDNGVCNDNATPVPNGTTYGTYGSANLWQGQTPLQDADDDSIMNYCSRDALTGSFATLLSGVDVWGSRQIYGTPTTRHGFMIVSDTDPTLALHARKGAQYGGFLEMTKGCTVNNPDCTWTYQRGALVSDKDPRFAITRVFDASGNPVVRLYRWASVQDGVTPYECTLGGWVENSAGKTVNVPATGDCTWDYKLGKFMLQNDTSYFLIAPSADSQIVGLNTACAQGATCTWTLPNVMLTSDRDATLPVNAFGGAVDGVRFKLNQDCDTTNGSCTFTFSKGYIRPTGNGSEALFAHGSATDGGAVVLGACSGTNPSTWCTWEWTHGLIESDDHHAGRFFLTAEGTTALTGNGTKPLTTENLAAITLRLSTVCGPSSNPNNPDCVYSGLSAKN